MNDKGEYSIQSKNFTKVENVINYYKKLTSAYPIKSIEDPFAEDDWNLGKKLPKLLEKMFK
jgi:enolase